MTATIQAEAWRACMCLAAMLILAAGCKQRSSEKSAAVSLERLIGDSDEDSPIDDRELFTFKNARPMASTNASKDSEAKRLRAQDREWRAERERREREYARLREIEDPQLWKAANHQTRWQLRCPVRVDLDGEVLGDVLVELSCQSGATIVLDPRLTTGTDQWSRLRVTGSTDGETPLWLVLTNLLKPLRLVALADFDKVIVTTLDFGDEWLLSVSDLQPEWIELPYTDIDPVGFNSFIKMDRDGPRAFCDEIVGTIDPNSWVSAGGQGWIEPCHPTEYNGDSLADREFYQSDMYFGFLLNRGVLVYNTHAVRSRIRRLVESRTTSERQARIEETRELYPYDTMRHRLNYENARQNGHSKGLKPSLSKTAVAQLDLHESEFGKDYRKDGELDGYADTARSDSLMLLHTEEVSKFIERAGFGFVRSPPPGPYCLPLPRASHVPFAKRTDQRLTTSLERYTSAKSVRELKLDRLPNESILAVFHHSCIDEFLDHRKFGHVVDRDHVAGFAPHAFGRLPELPNRRLESKLSYPIDRWAIGRLELVSLLKFDEPAVYFSQHLPRMDKLVDAKTRALNAFESEALSQLQAGDDLAVRYSLNHIQMVGSLRALKQCLDCHQVERGELLGAFSYDLWRDPPRK